MIPVITVTPDGERVTDCSAQLVLEDDSRVWGYVEAPRALLRSFPTNERPLTVLWPRVMLPQQPAEIDDDDSTVEVELYIRDVLILQDETRIRALAASWR